MSGLETEIDDAKDGIFTEMLTETKKAKNSRNKCLLCMLNGYGIFINIFISIILFIIVFIGPYNLLLIFCISNMIFRIAVTIYNIYINRKINHNKRVSDVMLKINKYLPLTLIFLDSIVMYFLYNLVIYIIFYPDSTGKGSNKFANNIIGVLYIPFLIHICINLYSTFFVNKL